MFFQLNSRFRIIFVLWGMTSTIFAQGTGFWEAIPGLDGTVDIIRVSGDDLIVGGLFESANGDSNASHIAKWNGSNWESLGNGLNNWVTSVAVDGNDIYVGGSFTAAGGQMNANFIARWDGSNWNPLGSGLNLHVSILLMDGNDLYAGGAFRNAGGNPDADRIAKWSGSSWEAMDKGFNDWVFAIAINNSGEFYAGGAFTAADGDTNVKFIAKWNDMDSVWEAFGNGLNHWVHHIGFNGNEMYIGGLFTDAGGDTNADHIAKWNGSGWEGLGPGLNGLFSEVEEFAFNGNDMYVVGQFNVVGMDSTFFNVAAWNGSAWEKMGIGVDQEARSLAILDDDLYIGGSFVSEVPGGQPYLPHMAKHSNLSTAIENNSNSIVRDFILFQNYPNPFNPTTNIGFRIADLGSTELKIYDILGREIRTLVSEELAPGAYEVQWDGRNNFGATVSTGVYIYRLRVSPNGQAAPSEKAGNIVLSRKMLFMR